MTPATSSVPDASRRAALIVHALAPQDREWLMGRLGVEQRSELARLLSELEMLGIPREPSFVAAAITRRTPDRDKMDRRVAFVLRAEPARLQQFLASDASPPALRAAIREEATARATTVEFPAAAMTPRKRRWNAGWLRIPGVPA